LLQWQIILSFCGKSVPEIDYHLRRLRGPILLATGNQITNQVNNVLVSLYISWCIDERFATKINRSDENGCC
jgi:hypothetical protein